MPDMPRQHRPKHAPTRQANRIAYDRARSKHSPWRKLYKTARWLAIRARQLSDHPLCVMCEAEGVVTTATVCDHVHRHGGDEARFFGGPFQSLCKSHHDRDKQRAEHAASTSPRP